MNDDRHSAGNEFHRRVRWALMGFVYAHAAETGEAPSLILDRVGLTMDRISEGELDLRLISDVCLACDGEPGFVIRKASKDPLP